MSIEEITLLNRFQNFIQDKKLIRPGEKILLAVSGGMDSLVMTILFSKTEIDFGIAHCNFSLRRNESDGDEEFVASLASALNKKFHSTRFDTKSFASDNKYSIQEAARKLRYNWFEKISIESNYQKIALAHHLDDSIETFFINMMRGTGTAGLKGISPINKKLIRPLLFATRLEIEEYAFENNISFREDSSNASDDYLRNRIRHHIIPVIKKESEGFEENMERLMEDFSLINDLVNERLDKWKNENVVTDDLNIRKIPLAIVRKENNSTSFLSLLLHSYGITGIDCKKILAVEMAGKIFQAKTYAILRDREFLIIQRNDFAKAETISITELPAKIKSGNLEISMSSETINNMAVNQNKIFSIDEEKINLPLILRTWQPGDYFFPLGMKGKKKISDFYTDEKIDRFQKDKILLLLSGKDIVCILGHRIDDRFKITPSTKKVLTIELSTT